MHPRFFPSPHNNHTRPAHSKEYEKIKFDSLFIGCPDEAGFGEECGRCRLPPTQIPLESRYPQMRYYNSNCKIARDKYRLALVSAPDEIGNVFRLMIPITEISEVRLHQVEGVRRYTIIFTAYPNRQLSAIEFIRDLSPGQRYNPTSNTQMLERHADIFHHRVLTITSSRHRLEALFRYMAQDAQRLIESLRVTTANPHWANPFIICSTLPPTQPSITAERSTIVSEVTEVVQDRTNSNVTSFLYYVYVRNATPADIQRIQRSIVMMKI